MKRVAYGLVCCWFVAVAAVPAFAATPAKGKTKGAAKAPAPAPAPAPVPPAAAGPSVSVSFLSSTRVSVTAALAGTKCATTDALAAACIGGSCAADDLRAVQGNVAATPFDLSSSSVPTWLTQGLAGESLYCAAPAVGAAAPVVTKIKVQLGALPAVPAPPAVPLEIDEGIDPVGPTPNTLVWGGWQAPPFVTVWAKLGSKLAATDTCSITRGAASLSCNVALSPSSIPGTQRVTITYSGDPVESGDLKFTIQGHPFHAPIFACAVKAGSGLPATLFAGAAMQKLDLGTTAECTRRLPRRSLLLRKDSVTLRATIETDEAAHLLRATLVDIPQPVAAGTWRIENLDGLHLGDVELKASQNPIKLLNPSDPTSNLPLLNVSYDLNDFDLSLDGWHDGKSHDGMAVVTGTRNDWRRYIQNEAALVIDQELRDLAINLKKASWEPPGAARSTAKVDCDSIVTSCDDLDQKYGEDSECLDDIPPLESARLDECHRARRAWRVKAHTWDSDVWVSEDVWWRNKEQSFQDELGSIKFAVFRQHADPFEVALELARYDPVAKSDDVVFRYNLKLANGARFESVPLPLASAVYVECGHQHSIYRPGLFQAKHAPQSDFSADIVLNGYTRAVEDVDVLSGNCRLHYSPDMLVSALKLPAGDRGRDLLNYYGTQELSVTVRRGEAEQTFPFRIEPAVEKEIELKVPRDAKNATGIYVVSAVLKGPALPAVAWRSPQANTDSAVTDRLGDLAFHANLRPRGPFGWRVAPIRMFLTLPVSFTGVRFPARPSEVSSSTASPNVQVTKILGGALLALEPWNYDTGRNPLPVPTRIVTGMNLYNVSDGKFVPSWLTGVSLTLPIIDLQKGITEDQLGTDVALGFFWETDVTEHDWLHHGNHFLITFGVNLLTLFGSK